MASVRSLFQIPHLRGQKLDVLGQKCHVDADGYVATLDGGGFTLEAAAALNRYRVAVPEEPREPGDVEKALEAARPKAFNGKKGGRR